MKKLLFLFACISLPVLLHAQQNTGGDVDDDELSFGFMFQYYNSDVKLFKRSYWRDPYVNNQTGLGITDSLTNIRSRHKPGFGLGFVANLKMGNNADLRFTPGLSFTDKEVLYTYAGVTTFGSPVISKVIQSTTVDFPLGIKIKSEERNNFRAYFLAGIKYSSNIISKKKTDDSSNPLLEKFLKATPNSLSYEAGIGLDLYFVYFKMSPEIKFSQSIGNVMKRDSSPYSYPIDKMLLHNLQFSLYFQ